MAAYRSAHFVNIGQWRFYPELMAAQNMHNGAPVYFNCRSDGTWVARGINVPADWMFKEICKWFATWIVGGTTTAAANLTAQVDDTTPTPS